MCLTVVACHDTVFWFCSLDDMQGSWFVENLWFSVHWSSDYQIFYMIKPMITLRQSYESKSVLINEKFHSTLHLWQNLWLLS